MVDIVLLREETRIERVQDGLGERLVDPRPLGSLDDNAWAEMVDLIGEAQTRLILTPPDVYATELILPRRIGGRMSQAVALQIGELAPLPSKQLRWAARPLQAEGETLPVEVSMVRLDRIEALLALFETKGMSAPDIWADAGRAPLLIEAASPTRRRLLGSRSPWTVALLLLLSIPLTTTLVATLMIWSNERAAAAAGDGADRILRADAYAREREALRRGIALVTRSLPVSQLLDHLAARLPNDASLTEAWTDVRGTLFLTIDAADPDAVRDVLEADPLFRFTQKDEGNSTEGRLRLTFMGRRR